MELVAAVLQAPSSPSALTHLQTLCCTLPELLSSNPCPWHPRSIHSCGSPSRLLSHSGRSSCRTCSPCRRWGTLPRSHLRTWPMVCYLGSIRRGRKDQHREHPHNCCTGST